LPGWLSTLSQIAPEDIDGFYRFMTLGSRLFELSQATFFRRHPGEAPDTGVLAGLRHFPLRYAWGRYDRTVRRLFRSPYLRQLYNRYPTYVGSSPYRAPATLAIIPYMELVFGGWYIIGGLYRLVETLERLLLDRDVVLLTDAPVCRIHREGDRVNGVELEDGRRLPADIVVMNGDASCAGVLFNDPSRRPMSLADRSMSGLVFLFGVKKTMPSRPHHTVFFSGDYEREFHQLCEEYRFPDDPTVYVNIASRTDRSVTPGEGETLFIMANAPATDEPWPEERIENARKAVMRRLRAGGLDFEDDIVVSDVWTPERMAMRYAMPGGAIYGTNSHGWKNAFLRTPNRDRRVRGLYYVGGSAHPGGGTPTVLMSARITADRIRQDAG
jgi:phytoene desaturase